MVATYRYIQLSHEQEAVTKALEDGEIPFIPLKGAVLRDFYPESWMRASCDMDILISSALLSGDKYKKCPLRINAEGIFLWCH